MFYSKLIICTFLKIHRFYTIIPPPNTIFLSNLKNRFLVNFYIIKNSPNIKTLNFTKPLHQHKIFLNASRTNNFTSWPMWKSKFIDKFLIFSRKRILEKTLC